MPGDLREASPDEFWDRLRLAMGKDGLLTYRYLGRRTTAMHDVSYDSMVLRRDMRNRQGGLMAAPLAIATAEAGGFSDFDSVPAPMTANLTILDAGIGVEEIRVDRTTVHRGRNVGFTRSVIRDAGDGQRILALVSGSGMKLGAAPPTGGERFALDEQILDRASLPPLTTIFGAVQDEHGQWLLPALEPRSRSTLGSLHLGPIHVVLEAAATDAAGEEAGQVREWNMQFTSSGTIGPFLARVDEIVTTQAGIAIHARLKDAGKGNRTIAAVMASFEKLNIVSSSDETRHE